MAEQSTAEYYSTLEYDAARRSTAKHESRSERQEGEHGAARRSSSTAEQHSEAAQQSTATEYGHRARQFCRALQHGMTAEHVGSAQR